jgi:hypothetical protein
MTEPFAGLLPHLERYLGPVGEFEEPTVLGYNRGYGLFFCYAPNYIVSVVTNGLRFQRLTVVYPQELVCTVRVDQRKDAHLLVPLTAGIVMQRGSGLMIDEIILSADPEPIVPGTEIAGVIAANHPYADDGFDTLTTPTGAVELQLITLIPATRPELELAQRSGIDALYDIWEKEGTDLLDMRRPSTV